MNKKGQKIKVVPDNYTAVTPWIISRSTEEMIKFLTVVLDAVEIPNSKIKNEDGVVIHAVVRIDDAIVMLFDSREGWGPTPAFLNVYVEDVEKAYKKAIDLGATSVTEITPLWFGEKVCRILDPFGNLIWLNERIEEIDFTDVGEVGKRATTPEAIRGIVYIQKSLDEAMKKQKALIQRAYN
jgi:uncharacterized glyoxalase superfamily protein PhnB